MTSAYRSYLISRFVILFAVLIAVSLGIVVWNINFWPAEDREAMSEGIASAEGVGKSLWARIS